MLTHTKEQKVLWAFVFQTIQNLFGLIPCTVNNGLHGSLENLDVFIRRCAGGTSRAHQFVNSNCNVHAFRANSNQLTNSAFFRNQEASAEVGCHLIDADTDLELPRHGFKTRTLIDDGLEHANLGLFRRSNLPGNRVSV